jgi:ATP-dependent exoDNAse (exonuclease V) beta subunit
MADPSLVPDRAERARALDPERSFIVRAPAGSGKTDLLIKRYLALLARVENPEEIVAITFTKKAAGEMRERVREALAEGKAKDRWELRQNPARLRIQTIDALCASLTRQMPMLSRFGAQPEIVEDARSLYLEAARATLDPATLDESAARLLAHLDNNAARVEELLADMLARRDHWIRHLRDMDRAALEAALANEGARLVARAQVLYPGEAPADVQAWQALALSLLTQKRTWRKHSKEAQALSANEPLRQALADLLDAPPAQYTDAQWEVLTALEPLLKLALAQLELVFRSRGEVDFTEVSRRALYALGTGDAPTDLALALDYRIRHLLVDEFQDTSISQYELIARLTTGWEPGDGRTLFAVGDPMQSIYRFREAEVGEFLNTWKSGRLGEVDVERVRLKANFRSQAGIVEWLNAAFARVMPLTEDAAAGAVPYADSSAVRAALRGDAVTVHPFFNGDLEGEAKRVVELVARVRSEEPESSVAILVRNRSHLAEIVPRLRDSGLRFRAVEITSLERRPVVQDLHSLARALSHPGDRLAWLAILRAPWCGLTLEELHALVVPAQAGTQTIFELMAGSPRLARICSVLSPALANRLRGSLRDRVEAAWLSLGGPACVEDETDLEDACVYLDALEEAEEAGAIVELAAFEQRLQKLWALPDVNAAPNDVQIMTIHKAKGLEFDHVIVPGLGRVPRGDDKRLFLWMERPGGEREELLIAPIEETGAEDDPIYKCVKKLDAERAGHEAARLLYVAATRAKLRLHLLGEVKLAAGGGIKPTSSRSLLGKLWQVVERQFVPLFPAEQMPLRGASVSDRVVPNQDLIRLASDWALPAPPPTAVWTPPVDEARTQDDIEFSWVGETARHVGSVVHRWLQRIGEDALVGWDEERIAGMREAVSAQLSGRGVPEAELDWASDRVLAALANAITDEKGRWLLGPHERAYSEHRLVAVIDGERRRLVIDRLFATREGEQWVVDYKTSSHEGADVEAFLGREQERYAEQLRRYADALGGKARCGLYFPLLGGWRELAR